MVNAIEFAVIAIIVLIQSSTIWSGWFKSSIVGHLARFPLPIMSLSESDVKQKDSSTRAQAGPGGPGTADSAA